MEALGYALEWVLVFILSTTLHEFAHAIAAKIGGDMTAYSAGQVSLNPAAHIRRQPFGMLILPLVSAVALGWPFGFASVPVDPSWAYKHPRKSAWVSAAGPAANLLLVVICGIIIKLLIAAGIFFEPQSVNLTSVVDAGQGQLVNGLAIFLSMMFTENIILFIFNLLPLPPLDGSSIISLFLPEETARRYGAVVSNPAFGIFGLFIAWQIGEPIIDVAFTAVLNTLYWGANFG